MGNTGRNAFTGPGAEWADLLLPKKFRMRWERRSLDLRAEAINFPNRANFATPDQNWQAGNFGRMTGLKPGALGRILQQGLRYGF